MNQPAPVRPSLGDGWSIWPVAALRIAGMPFSWLAWLAADVQAEDAARARSAAAGRSLARQGRFAEAVQWQNPGLVANWFGAYRQAVLTAGDHDDRPVPLARRDQRETLLATLAQRYCAKNETIGFFGPVAWARFDEDAASTVVCGSGGLRSRTAYLEWHAVSAIAAAAAQDEELRMVLPLRRHPLVSICAGRITGPRGRYDPRASLATQIVTALAVPATEDCLREKVGGAEFEAALGSLVADGIVLRDLPVPVGDRPEEFLTRRLETLDDVPARKAWLARMAEVRAALGAVGAAAGDADALASAMTGLDLVLGRVTGAGRYGQDERAGCYGRSAAYEDCRADLDVTIGADLLRALSAPLALLLRSARWLVTEAGHEVLAALRPVHERLARAGQPVTLNTLVLAGADVLSGAPETAVHHVVADFRARWAEVLGLADGDGRLDSAAAHPLVTALFPDEGAPPWQAARQHSPDVMVRVRRDGTLQWVLGELHLALNTLENRPFRSQSDDDADELLRGSRADFPLGRIVPVWPGSAPEVTSRTYPPLALDLPDAYDYWSYAKDEGHWAGRESWPGSLLHVLAEGKALHVTPADGSWRRPLGEFLGEFLTALVASRFEIREPAPHAPRLMIDDVVVERETWRVPASELLAAAARTDYRHSQLATALADLGCPRYVFASLPGQRKPVLVDRQAPLLLRAFVRLLRASAMDEPAAQVKLVEMLPEPETLWLRDADGEPITSELRVVVAEPAGHAAAGITLPNRPSDVR